MLQGVHFVSQQHAEQIDGRPDVIVVSISADFQRPQLRSGFRDVLSLHFEDYDRERDGIDALAKPFTVAHAETLRAWVDEYAISDQSYTLMIHCSAGISRSAAVAWWVHKTHRCPLLTTFPAWYLNKYVLRTLDPAIAPPPRPADAPEMPAERTFQPLPDLGAMT